MAAEPYRKDRLTTIKPAIPRVRYTHQVNSDPHHDLLVHDQPLMAAANLNSTSPNGIARASLIFPCVPTAVSAIPNGPEWIHEVKHDGYRMICRRHEQQVQILFHGHLDVTERLPWIAKAMRALTVCSAIIDGEAVVCDEAGATDFDCLRRALKYRGYAQEAFLYAFDLIELDGQDLRCASWQTRRAALMSVLPHDKSYGIRVTEALRGVAGSAAIERGCEGIISKRRDRPYDSGRSLNWLKTDNPNASASTRVFEIGDPFIPAGIAARHPS